MKQYLPWLAIALFATSCKGLFQYSPNEVRLEDADKNLNAKNIAKLRDLPVKDTFRFVVIGDSQRFYEETDDFVDSVNKRNDVAFVLLNGDITDFGLNKEYQWISRSLKRLQVPYIGVIGNHDMLANGRKVFNEMFGPENFSFEYSGNKFVCLNTNSLEVGNDGSVPDLPWLQSQLTGNHRYKNAFVFGHMSPLDEEFDKTKAAAYKSILESPGNVRLSIHGHQHKFSVQRPDPEGIEYLVAASVSKRSYALVTVTGNTYRIEEKKY
jgi:predicted phosphodiesterase